MIQVILFIFFASTACIANEYDEQLVAWKRWNMVRGQYPAAKSFTLEKTLYDFSEEIRKHVGYSSPGSRIYISDALNPDLWPMGEGFLVIHAGLLHKLQDEKQFLFLLGLELAHEALGHRLWPRSQRVNEIIIQRQMAAEGTWVKERELEEKVLSEKDIEGKESYQKYEDAIVKGLQEQKKNTNHLPAIAVQVLDPTHWAIFTHDDPIAEFGLSYTWQQQVSALGIVFRLFRDRGWDARETGKEIVQILKEISPVISSISDLYEHLNAALEQPIDVSPKDPEFLTHVDPIKDQQMYKVIKRELLETSINSLQRNPWLMEMLEVKEKRKSWHATFFIEGELAIANKKWEHLLDVSKKALEYSPESEPFKWQRAVARVQLRQFSLCGAELARSWVSFDHLRQKLLMQCLFLDGRYSMALDLATSFRKQFPVDLEGAFWEALVRIRIRKPVKENIRHMEKFWGDRPMVQALKIFDMTYRFKKEDAKKFKPFSDEQLSFYTEQEKGILDFARVWSHEFFTSSITGAGGQDIKELRKAAEARWSLSSQIWNNLPKLSR